MRNALKSSVAGLLFAAGSSLAITLDTGDASSVTNAAKTIAKRVVSLYNGTEPGEIPGLFPSPYYFWESGLAWDSLINYWALTGDDTYNDIINQALVFQISPNDNFMPLNQSKNLGNDDQSFWALAAMTAAEQGFPAPAGRSDNITWLDLAVNVFDSQITRWDDASCNGGIRWQIYPFNNGYDYKNALSNGNLNQLASRLALYTGNSTYEDWAQKIVEWSFNSGLISNVTGAVYDGFTVNTCSAVAQVQWSAYTATYISAAAHLSNYSSSRTNNAPLFPLFVNLNETFTVDGVLYEQACELSDFCNVDQLAFKSITSRALAKYRDLTFDSTTTINGTSAGTIHQRINSVIQASAKAAAAQCTGGDSGSACGSSWLNGTFNGNTGLGQELSALEIVLATLPGKKLRNVNSTTPVTSGSSSSANGTSTSGSTRTSASASSGVSGTSSGASASSTGGASSMSGSLVGLTLAVGFAVVGFAV